MDILKKQFIKSNVGMNGANTYDSPAIRFRRKFTLTSVKQATLYVCGLGYGYYYINGKKVSEDLFTAPVSDYQKTVWYNKYDVSHLLAEGENLFSAILGNGFLNENFPSAWHHDLAAWRDTPKLFATLVVDNKVVFSTDEQFLFKKDNCIYFNQLRSGEYWDYNKKEDWTSIDFDDSDWGNAILDAPELTGELAECTCEPIRECGEYKAQRIIRYKDKYIFDIGQNISGYIRFKGKLAKGQEISIFHGETMEEDGNLWLDETTVLCNLNLFTKTVPFQTDKIIGNGEWLEWSPMFTYHGFRYVEITGLQEEPTLDMVTGIFVHQDVERTSTFECSNAILNKIYQMGIMATYSNMHYALTDCPTREKLGWLNDAAASIQQILINFKSENFFKKWIRDIIETMKPDGAVSGIAPTPNWGYDFGGVCTIGFAEIPYYVYKKTGDIRIIEYALPHIEKHFAYYDNAVKGNVPGFMLGDWTGSTNRETPIVLVEKFICLRFLKVLIEFRGKLGVSCEDLYAKVEHYRKKICELAFEDGRLLYKNQTLASMLIVEGFDKGDLQEELLKIIENNPIIDCGMMGVQYLYKALSICGRNDLVVKLLINPDSFYYRWIKDGETTLVESFDPEPHTRSKNHHMFSNILAWYYEELLGIQYDAASAIKQVVLKPCKDFPLQYAKGSVRFDDGEIFVAVSKTEKGIIYTIETSGELYVEYEGKSLLGQHTIVVR